MFGYATNLRGRSQGRGQFSMQPSHYTEVPKNIAEKIISGGFGSGLDKYDPWEARRYELVKEYVLRDLAHDKVNTDKAVAFADDVIAALKKPEE